MLSSMRYKTFIWPHNPRSCQLETARLTAVHKIPMGAYLVEDLGRTVRTLRGEGAFFGSTAYEKLKKLLRVFEEDGPGVLLHPIIQMEQAYFTELKLLEEPRADYVSYSFVFQEDSGELAQAAAPAAVETEAVEANARAERYHTVVAGDTLWAIARNYGTTVANLTALNGWLANPNLIYAGEQVRVK